MNNSETILIGIDVGGTNIKYGLITCSGNVIASSQFATEQERGPEDAMQRAAQAVQQMIEEQAIPAHQIAAAGLGTPGSIDIPHGMILEPPNLPAWRHFPVRDALAAALELPVFFCNDANAAAMGEYWVGGGRDYSSIVLLTLGTGVGGGIIINDFLIDGFNSLGAECGHVTVDFSDDARQCSCGHHGHLEAYASATSLVDRYNERISEANPRSLTALEIAERAEQKDAVAIDIIEETADYLARGIAIFGHVIDPEVFILGGAMNFGGADSPVGVAFKSRIESAARRQTYGKISENLKIEYAQLGGAAGWIGAAGIARKNYSQKTAEPCDLQ